MSYWVYILQSESTGKTYTGQTSDLKRRLNEHNHPAIGQIKRWTRAKKEALVAGDIAKLRIEYNL